MLVKSGITAALSCAAVIVMTAFVASVGASSSRTEVSVDDAVLEVEEETVEVMADGEEDDAEADEAEEAKEPAFTFYRDREDYHLLVCVPADVMWLRSKPGLDEDGRVAELYGGTLLKWRGESEIVNGTEYYFVTVENSSQTGYVSERYCVEAEFYADESALDIVETQDALYTYDMMREDIDRLCAEYPDRLSAEVIGSSVLGRDIIALTIGSPDAKEHVMMQASIHGREYMNTQLVMKLTEYYCKFYDIGEYRGISYRDLFARTAIHLVPMANPDGVTISQAGDGGDKPLDGAAEAAYNRDSIKLVLSEDGNGDPYWVDHYRDEEFDNAVSGYSRLISPGEYLSLWKANGRGVDLNNNFDSGFYEMELKGAPSYANYKGEGPLSEPESEALAELALRRDYRFFVSYHSRGQLIYYNAKGNTPENSAASERLASLMEAHTKYMKVNAAEDEGLNRGGFGDWVQSELRKPSITVESGRHACPLDIGEFPAMWGRHRESWAMLLYELEKIS